MSLNKFKMDTLLVKQETVEEKPKAKEVISKKKKK
jgi:hypothetical protein